jgi:hypothetical protein
MTCHNKLILAVGILGVLSGIASIPLILLDLPKIGGILALGWMPAALACIEWRCRDRPRSPLKGISDSVTGADKITVPESRFVSGEALPTPLEVRINIAPDSVRGK